MTCDYCFYCDEAKKRTQHVYGMMNEKTLETIIEKTISEADAVASFTWQGGEPTLRGLDFFRKALYLQKKYNRNHLQVINAFQTNGYGITDDWCMFFKENKFLVGVSVDGLPEIHDSIRHNKIGDGTFEQINKNIKLLDKYNVEYNILTSVYRMFAVDCFRKYFCNRRLTGSSCPAEQICMSDTVCIDLVLKRPDDRILSFYIFEFIRTEFTV